MSPRGVTLSEGLHSGSDMCAGCQGWMAMGISRCSVVVIHISIFLWLDLDDAGRTEAVGGKKSLKTVTEKTEARFVRKSVKITQKDTCLHPTPKTIPVEAAENIKPLVFTPVKIQTQNGRKNEQHHGKVFDTSAMKTTGHLTGRTNKSK
ncbi:hypothetical protein E2320_010180 [Naja naja]|nr:hypothetical protein E2320_010180 [Naja naja]